MNARIHAVIVPLCGWLVLFSALFVPSVSWATEWVEVLSDYESGLFVDKASIGVKGSVTEAVLLWNFADMQMTRRPFKPYRSATRLTYFKCAERLRASVESKLYMDAMAQGDVTDVYRTPDDALRWEWVDLGAPGGKSMLFVCEEAAKAGTQ
jgi:hypothetical protein